MKTDINNFIIEQLQSSDIDKVATILTNAFHTNPAYSAIFKNKSRLKEGLFWLFKASLIMNNQKQTLTRIVKEKHSKEIVGTFTLIPPEGVKNSVSIYSKIRIGSFIVQFGLSTLFRMLSLESKNKELLAKAIKNAEHYYLSMVVVKEEYRGYGIGSFMIKHVIDNLLCSKPACNLIGLTTQLPENVIFYSRLGFRKINDENVTFRESEYYNCNMKHEML
ncbi:MAG: GNAT family N-acetyltransferase [Dysgonomonas sp.]